MSETNTRNQNTPRLWRGAQPMALIGIGHALPGPAIETDDLLRRIDQNFGTQAAKRGSVFARKMGIEARHIARDLKHWNEGPRSGDSNPELAARAIEQALEQAGLTVKDIGYLIGHTATPHQPVPSNTAFVADRLGYAGPHMELRQACTGFANALVVAEGLLAAPGARPVVIVGSETGSSFFDPAMLDSDPGQLVNLVQMGDGAAAVILAPEGYRASQPQLGTLSHTYFGSIGLGRTPGFSLQEGGSARPFPRERVLAFDHAFSDIRANGADLFAAGLQSVASNTDINIAGVTRIVPHQANGIMASLIEEHFDIPAARIHVEANRRGNTGSAAIWLALSSLVPNMKPCNTALILGAEATKYMFGGFLYTAGPA